MLRPIESLCLAVEERDTKLAFAADFAAEEIERLSGRRPPVVAPSEVSTFSFSIEFAWFPKNRKGAEDSYELSSSDASVTIFSSSMRGLLFGIGRFLRMESRARGISGYSIALAA